MSLSDRFREFMNRPTVTVSGVSDDWILEPKYAAVRDAGAAVYEVARAKPGFTNKNEDAMKLLMGALLENWGPRNLAKNWRADVEKALATIADEASVEALREACRKVDRDDGYVWPEEVH